MVKISLFVTFILPLKQFTFSQASIALLGYFYNKSFHNYCYGKWLLIEIVKPFSHTISIKTQVVYASE